MRFIKAYGYLIMVFIVFLGTSNKQYKAISVIDSVGHMTLYKDVCDSLTKLSILYYDNSLCWYNLGLCIESINISFYLGTSSIMCERYITSYDPHGVAGVSYMCTDSLFIYINLLPYDSNKLVCNSNIQFMKELLGNNIFEEGEKACELLHEKYKLMFVEDCLLINENFRENLYGIKISIYCNDFAIFARSSTLTSKIKNSMSIQVRFKICE